MNKTEFETAREASIRLGVTPRTIQKWTATGKFFGTIKHGKSLLIPKNTVVTDNTNKKHNNS